jgi:hypothetical protein
MSQSSARSALTTWKLAFATTWLVACGARTTLADGDGGGYGDERARSGVSSAAGDNVGSAGGSVSSAANATAGGNSGGGGAEPTPAPQCLCPDEPGFVECALPFMCCPCAGTCENPDSFNCSCEDPRTCVDLRDDAGDP